jgi:hypothetical protein
MALLTRKQFAELVERNPAALTVDIADSRLSAYEPDKKFIDTENPLNAAYIRKWRYKNNVDLLGESEAVSTTRKPFATKEIQQKIAYQTAKDQKKVEQDERKKDLEMENLQLKIQREQLMLDKAAGKLLPIDLVEGVLKRHGNSFLKNFEKGIENIAGMFCNIMVGGDQKYYVRIMEECRAVLAQCIQKAGSDAEQEVDQLVEDYSETLLRGPRK